VCKIVRNGTLVTMLRRTNAFYIQSPRLQNAVPFSENLVLRILGVLPYMSVHVDFDIVFGPDFGVKVRIA